MHPNSTEKVIKQCRIKKEKERKEGRLGRGKNEGKQRQEGREEGRREGGREAWKEGAKKEGKRRKGKKHLEAKIIYSSTLMYVQDVPDCGYE